MLKILRIGWICACLLLGLGGTGQAQTCPSLLEHQFLRLQDEKPQNLCQYAGKVILVVNTASYCGFTSQYKDLEALYAKYKDQGLVVLGFPSNDFSQEPDANAKIADFCENTYGVKFPMFAKTTVVGEGANPFYIKLKKTTGSSPKWNFHKYLIARDGKTVESYNSLNGPMSSQITQKVEAWLRAKP